MIFLAPIFLAIGGLVALGVVGLHFLSTREPKTDLLPTVRFVPDLPVRATAVTIRFQDRLLMLIRVGLVLLVALALSRPQLKPLHRDVARIVAIDMSRAVGQPDELADSARAYIADAASVILFDVTAREVNRRAADSIAALAGAPRSLAAPRGSLSAALIAARRVAARIRDGADSLELVVISPFVEEERDAATSTIRDLWPGRITIVPVTPATFSSEAASVTVEWADSSQSSFWSARTAPDTITGVRAGNAVMVYPFLRRWQAAVKTDSATRVYARWVDGEPAAFERLSATGCVRSIAIGLPTAGDAVLRPDFQRFLSALGSPCGDPRDLAVLAPSYLDGFGRGGPLAPTSQIQRRDMRVTPIVPWLLAIAVGLAVFEMLVRRRSGFRMVPRVDTPDREVSRAA